MNYTENYQLPQWVESDRVLMEDFNDAMTKIDQGMDAISKIALGTYIGTGTYGDTSPNHLELEFQPKLVVLVANAGEMLRNGAVLVFGQTESSGMGSAYSSGSCLNLSITWAENGLTWYGKDAERQLNKENTTYFFFALG